MLIKASGKLNGIVVNKRVVAVPFLNLLIVGVCYSKRAAVVGNYCTALGIVNIHPFIHFHCHHNSIVFLKGSLPRKIRNSKCCKTFNTPLFYFIFVKGSLLLCAYKINNSKLMMGCTVNCVFVSTL